ncbi:MAG: M20/M25/M40 family metallo-hydrolase, partial [Bacteroidaceae bacterium]|nr:M20/M25/M40 family metallo-hydrolase [Bacteroidaceae bacterium]
MPSPNSHHAVKLLQELIACPSVSRDEGGTADILQRALQERGVAGVGRLHNNIYARAAAWDDTKPVLLLCSHHDTVRPAAGYTRPPFTPTVEDGRLYGLGANDAGASLVGLFEAFCALQSEPLDVNL